MADNESPFAKFEAKAWPFWYEGELVADRICGGVPSNEKTAEAWIRAKLKDTRSESEVKALVRKTTEEIRDTHKAAGRKPEAELADALDVEATALVVPQLSEAELTEQAINQVASDMAGFNMFKRAGSGPEYKGLTEGVLYIEGRQLKAALKEAVAVAANAGKIRTKNWGDPDNAAYKKQLKGWFPEHVFVTDTLLPLRTVDGDEVTEPNGVLQKFVHTHRGDAIGYEEYVDQAVVRFHVKTDVELTEEEWAMIWLTGQDQGLGASRSQGFGVYTVTGWRPVPLRERTTR
jgi:ribosomal protein S20